MRSTVREELCDGGGAPCALLHFDHCVLRGDPAVELDQLDDDFLQADFGDRKTLRSDVFVRPIVATGGDHLREEEAVVDSEALATHHLHRIESFEKALERARIVDPPLHHVARHFGEVFRDASDELCSLAIVGFRRHDVFSYALAGFLGMRFRHSQEMLMSHN